LLLPAASYTLAALFKSELLLLLSAGFSAVLVITAAIVGIVLGVRSRRDSGWRTAGLVTGIIGIVVSVLMTGLLVFFLVG
jgi:branched-subunit amino acid transport protein